MLAKQLYQPLDVQLDILTIRELPEQNGARHLSATA
jgi:hypothetical protein